MLGKTKDLRAASVGKGVLVAKLAELSSIPRAGMMEEDNQFLQIVL